MKQRRLLPEYIWFVLLLLLTGYAYRGLGDTAFRQDEWATLGMTIASGPFSFLHGVTVIDALGGKLRILGSAVNALFHYFFPFQVFPFVLFGFLVHAINGALVFLVARRLTKSRLTACIASLVFVTSFTISQGLTWFAAITTTLPNTTFFLLSLLSLISYLEQGSRPKLLWSYLFLYISVLFKESSLFGFVVFPLIILLTGVKKERRNGFRTGLVLLVVLCLFSVAGRIQGLFGSEGQVTGFATKSGNTVPTIAVHMLFYPVTSFSQLYMPRQLLFRLSSVVQQFQYPFLAQSVLQSAILENITADMVSLFLTFWFFTAVFLCYIYGQKHRKTLLFLLVLILCSFLPFALINKGTSYLDSRYYYLPMSMGAALIAVLLHIAMDVLIRTAQKTGFVIGCLLFAGVAGYAYKNTVFIHRDIVSLTRDARIQNGILDAVAKNGAHLPDRPVFYLTGNRTYYGVDNLYVPLQAGPAYIFMTILYDTGKVPRALLAESYLLDVRHEGYRRSGEKGFGYFSRFASLQHAVESGAVEPKQIVAYYYDSDAYTLTEYTGQVLAQLHAK